MLQDAETNIADAITRDFSNDCSITVIDSTCADSLTAMDKHIQHHRNLYRLALARQRYHIAFYEEDKSDSQRQVERMLNLLEEAMALCLTLDTPLLASEVANDGLYGRGELGAMVIGATQAIQGSLDTASLSLGTHQSALVTMTSLAFARHSKLIQQLNEQKAQPEVLMVAQEACLGLAALFSQLINRTCYDRIHSEIVAPLLSYEDCSNEASASGREQALVQDIVEKIMAAFAKEAQDKPVEESASTACKTTSVLLKNAAKGMPSKKNPLKKRLRGFAGVALSISTLELGFGKNGYRNYFLDKRNKLEKALGDKGLSLSHSSIQRKPKSKKL